MKKRIMNLLLSAVLFLTLSVPIIAAEPDDTDGEYVSVALTMVKTPVTKGGQGVTIPWDPDALAGKTISILGDSISTYRNFSNRQGSRWSNITIGRGKAWYSDLKPKIALSDTWWYQLTEDLGVRVLVDNSWSGSTFFQTHSRAQGAYLDRCVQLHDNTGINDGAEPDIIIIFLGTNDFTYFRGTIGAGEVNYEALISEGEDGAATYSEPTTTMEAAAICLDKISRRYPLAEVYLMELPVRGDADDAVLDKLKEFNRDMAAVAEHFGVTVIPTYDGPITLETAAHYYLDGRLHPNELGMDVITEAAKKTILEHTAWKAEPYHLVSFDLTGAEADYGTDKLVREGSTFTGKLKPTEEGAELIVTVTMNGEDITAEVYSDGLIEIPSVTAAVTITASSKK